MRLRTGLTIGLVAMLVILGGCKKKRPPIPPPPVPTISQPQSLPPLPPAVEPLPPPEPEKPAVLTKPRPRKPVVRKPAPEPVKPEPEVKESPAPAPPSQISAGKSAAVEAQQRQDAIQLQQAAEYNLQSISRRLTEQEQAMVQQIKSYVEQSRAAEADGDTERAYNLALKARLLSDELIKPR